MDTTGSTGGTHHLRGTHPVNALPVSAPQTSLEIPETLACALRALSTAENPHDKSKLTTNKINTTSADPHRSHTHACPEVQPLHALDPNCVPARSTTLRINQVDSPTTERHKSTRRPGHARDVSSHHRSPRQRGQRSPLSPHQPSRISKHARFEPPVQAVPAQHHILAPNGPRTSTPPNYITIPITEATSAQLQHYVRSETSREHPLSQHFKSTSSACLTRLNAHHTTQLSAAHLELAKAQEAAVGVSARTLAQFHEQVAAAFIPVAECRRTNGGGTLGEELTAWRKEAKGQWLDLKKLLEDYHAVCQAINDLSVEMVEGSAKGYGVQIREINAVYADERGKMQAEAGREMRLLAGEVVQEETAFRARQERLRRETKALMEKLAGDAAEDEVADAGHAGIE